MLHRSMKVLLVALFLPMIVQAQTGMVAGTVTDSKTGEALAGANVIIEGTTLGAAADVDGNYSISNVAAGTVTVSASVIGYEDGSQTVNVPEGGTVTASFSLAPSAIMLSGLEVMADRATRATPVAYSTVEKEDMKMRLGSRDIPMVLNMTPSVYATAGGGGAGDSRMNVRGFNQRNVAIMINGVPVNDMENAWVYWSNWDGVGDATASIQMQRGLSNVNLATPSIGGTMNIITDPTALASGGNFRQEVGSWGLLKSTLNYNTGLINDKMAFSATIVRKTGDGYYSGTWTDAWAYYFGASYAISDNDRLEFYAVGAPQRHGQNLYKQNIGVYSEAFAKDLDDYDEAALEDFTEVGRDYNQNYNDVSASYSGKQYWSMYSIRDGEDRHDDDFLMERENYFHKPLVNLNWYHTLNDQMRLTSIFYWSGGVGGGTGTYGSLEWDSSGPSRIIDWDATIAENDTSINATYSATENASSGILRNSVNQQWQLGAISKFYFDVSDNLKTVFGLDWRHAIIGHWREVRDLLGGDYYVYTGDDFDTSNDDKMKRLGDKIAYHNTNTVDWIGFFGQAEFAAGPISGYGMAGFSTVSYSYTDHFSDDGSGDEVFAENNGIGAYQIKGGGMYRLSEGLGVFFNGGYVLGTPIFDATINDYDGTVIDDPENEKFLSFEAGLNFAGMGGMATANINYYNTTWKDRSNMRGITNLDGSDATVFLTGMDASHTGIEIEGTFQPMSMVRLNAAISLGNWTFTDDVTGTYKDWSTGTVVVEDYNYYVKDLKVGDAPQTQFALGASLFPIDGLSAQLVYRYYTKNYADWNVFNRTDPDDREQSWEAPAYGIADVHAIYNLPLDLMGTKLQVFAHLFNILDTEYIQDAVDNSSYNSYQIDRTIVNPHKADAAEVYFGMPMSMNVGLAIHF